MVCFLGERTEGGETDLARWLGESTEGAVKELETIVNACASGVGDSLRGVPDDKREDSTVRGGGECEAPGGSGDSRIRGGDG